MSKRILIAGILIGFLVGVAIVIGFLFWDGDSAIDASDLNQGRGEQTTDQPAQEQAPN